MWFGGGERLLQPPARSLTNYSNLSNYKHFPKVFLRRYVKEFILLYLTPYSPSFPCVYYYDLRNYLPPSPFTL